jgi:small subunit ribosomal protein S10e
MLLMRNIFRYLTNEGIDYLRQYLHLPAEIVPSTLKRTTRSDTARPRAAPRGGEGGPKGGEDRQSYRRNPGQSGDKKADVGAGAGDLELVSFTHAIKMLIC